MGITDVFRRPRRLDLHRPDPRTRLGELDLLAVDMETTGLDPRRHHIVALGWVPVTAGVIDLAGAERVLVRGVEVGQSATVHMLTDAALADGVPLGDGIDRLLAALDGRALLAHFAALEVSFLSAACDRLKAARPDLAVVDTFALERRHMERCGTYPRGEDLRLPRVRRRYHLPTYPNHDALTDALACAELYLAQTADRPGATLRELERLSPR